MTKPPSEEAYITQRYERWKGMAVPFDYKATKSRRIGQIMIETGGIPDRGLELGVGPGGIAGPLSRTGIQIVGVDLSWEALERAHAQCEHERVLLVRGSGFSLPFANEVFPIVYASQVLHLFDSDGRLRLMREIKRVLRPGSRFVFDMKNALTHPVRYGTSSASRKRRNFPSTSEIDRLLREAGFCHIEHRPGVMPALGAIDVPNLGLLRLVAHTRFFIARV